MTTAEYTRVAVTALGADRPGIVAALTGPLVDLGGNLEGSSMSMLQGQFAVLLVIAVPGGVTPADVESVLAPAAEALDLVVVARAIAEGAIAEGSDESDPATPEDSEGAVFAFSVHGADRPGIVHRAASAVADVQGNIVDLSTRIVGSPSDPVYVLTLTVGFAPGVDATGAVETACAVVEAYGVQCHAHRVEIDVL